MLKGTLDDFSLPDVFRLMYLARKTGKLEVERSAGNGKVFIRDGDVYYAESSLAREPLGQKLIRSGALTDGALMKALDENAATGQRVGEILIAQGSVSVEQLQRAVQQQIEDSVFDLMRWEAGSFEWQPGVVADVEVPIAISVENLIMEASRRLDELEVIRRKIPSENAVLAMAAKPPEGAVEINIQPEEWRMLVLVNGSRTVSEIGEMTGTDDFSAMRSLYGLVSAGLVDVIDPGTESQESGPSEVVAGFDRPAPTVAPVEEDDSPAAAALKAAGYTQTPGQDAASNGTVLDDLADLQDDDLEQINVEDQVMEPSAAIQAEEEEAEQTAAPEEAAAFIDLDAASDTDTASEFEADPVVHPEAEVESVPESNDPAILEGFGLELDPGSIDEASGAQAELDEAFSADLSDDVSVESASDDSTGWNEVPIESFDEPGPDELVTRTAEADDPFLNDLFDASTPPAAPPAAAESEEIDIPAPPMEAPPPAEAESEQPPAPAPAAPAAETPSAPEPAGRVDRAAVARELAGLFSDEERPAARQRQQAAKSGAPEEDEDVRKRVEDDDAINKGLIGRLIDGVKGL